MGNVRVPKKIPLRPLYIELNIDLFLRPCLCYQLQSIEQNMYVLL